MAPSSPGIGASINPGANHIVQRKVLTPNDFTNLVEVQQRLLGFQQTAQPFDWRFTRSDLNQLLRRLDDQEQLTKAA
jgi:hypothetical protein